ncbi:hypothetical protein TNIN_475191 [Trichonephila inaurata madagascariensis]|uniref:Uncharacterized protein n=1 Tax=Trichonephila inaurata madagascariensis TaxID=2747483 RepID=A0A8X6Y796_9ARAC|nr:hypothetical protein TNIN_475191 [Trichonephila inaurata madagascariensis]
MTYDPTKKKWVQKGLEFSLCPSGNLLTRILTGISGYGCQKVHQVKNHDVTGLKLRCSPTPCPGGRERGNTELGCAPVWGTRAAVIIAEPPNKSNCLFHDEMKSFARVAYKTNHNVSRGVNL